MGRKPKRKKGPPTKWMVYEQILQIPYYVIFDRHTDEVQFFKLTQGSYLKIPSPTHTLWIPELELGLGRWEGVYDGWKRQWIRWYDKDDRWIPTLAERATRAEQQVELERQQVLSERERAARAEQQVELERQQVLSERERATRAEQQVALERQQAQLERERAAQLAAKLRALGIDPD